LKTRHKIPNIPASIHQLAVADSPARIREFAILAISYIIAPIACIPSGLPVVFFVNGCIIIVAITVRTDIDTIF
jgi:uncharacterized membrane protein YkvA (DUF1232 family)